MPLPYNNPKIGLETRAWLTRAAETDTVLDRGCLAPISAAIEACNRVHPGGLVHDLSVRAGARPNVAVLAGSIAQLFYCGCSFTDDLHDGDTDSYCGGLPMSIRMNAQLQLLCLVSLRLEELWAALGECARGRWAGELNYNRVLAIMLTGQRLELTRDDWGASAYQRVAKLSAGEQYAFYFRLIAATSDGRMAEWSRVGHAFGTLLQLVADWESADERLMSLGQDTVDEFRARFTQKLVDRAQPLGALFDSTLAAMLSRVKAKQE